MPHGPAALAPHPVLIDTLVICAPAGLPPTKSNRARR